MRNIEKHHLDEWSKSSNVYPSWYLQVPFLASSLDKISTQCKELMALQCPHDVANFDTFVQVIHCYSRTIFFSHANLLERNPFKKPWWILSHLVSHGRQTKINSRTLRTLFILSFPSIFRTLPSNALDPKATKRKNPAPRRRICSAEASGKRPSRRSQKFTSWEVAVLVSCSSRSNRRRSSSSCSCKIKG